jgi:hypothetical protein
MLEKVIREEKLDGSSDRMFGLLFAAILVSIALWPIMKGGQVRIWSLAAGGMFLVLALTNPRALSWLNRTWMRFGVLLNRIVSPVAIGVVYYLTLVPLALWMRILGKQPLQRKYDSQATSYWISRKPPGPSPQSMKDPF